MALPPQFRHPYEFDSKYSKRVAYFSMEFAIAQPLKIYSGGLGFLAGSHMRSAYELKQNMVGIGILWKHGYYDQVRSEDRSMQALFQEKFYSFLEDTGLKFKIAIGGSKVVVKSYYLRPELFGTAPMFLLSTDTPENDYLAQTTTHKLYDSDPAARIAQFTLLGQGGAKLLDLLGHDTEIYHLNEAHAHSAAYYLYSKFGSMDEVRKRMVLTTHTPEAAGNESHEINLLHKLGFFNGIELDTVREISGEQGDYYSHTLHALKTSKIANGVSKMHGEVAKRMWSENEGICPIISITNAQNAKYWQDKELAKAHEESDQETFDTRKTRLKQNLFEVVADQTGKLFRSDVLTVVIARRFAEYKRMDLITRNTQRFEKLVNDSERPVQIIWAGKPYPMDYGAVSVFNKLVHMSRSQNNCAVLVGYELALSRLLKNGADIWLNNPRITREASGTSGMTAAMNGAVNLSTQDGWIPEFAKDGQNSFLVPVVPEGLPLHEQDHHDQEAILDLLEQIAFTYYDNREEWDKIVAQSMEDVLPFFDSDRMAYQYYEKLYGY